MENRSADDARIRQTLDREVELVEGAIDLVASGGSPAATVAGLHLTEAVVGVVASRAAQRGVVLEILWGTEEEARDVRVHRPESPR